MSKMEWNKLDFSNCQDLTADTCGVKEKNQTTNIMTGIILQGNMAIKWCDNHNYISFELMVDINKIMFSSKHLQKFWLRGADSQASTQCRNVSLMRLCETHNELLVEDFRGRLLKTVSWTHPSKILQKLSKRITIPAVMNIILNA
jgi:hypothetical protein